MRVSAKSRESSWFLKACLLIGMVLACSFDLSAAQIKFPGQGGGSPAPGTDTRSGLGGQPGRNCLAGQLKFGASCFPAFTQGRPCPTGQWLVKVPGSVSNGQCAAEPCPAPQYLWTLPASVPGGPPVKSCNEKNFGPTTCPKIRPKMTGVIPDKNLRVGVCDCSFNHVYWPEDDRCYKQYTQGPCQEGEVFVYDPEERSLGCQTNPCDAEGFALWTDEQCYELDTQGPCPAPDMAFVVNATSLTLTCEELNTDIRQIIKLDNPCPSGTKRDFKGNCSQMTYINGGAGGVCDKGFIRKPDGTCVKWSG